MRLLQGSVLPWLFSVGMHGAIAAAVYGIGPQQTRPPSVPIQVELRVPQVKMVSPAPAAAAPAVAAPESRPTSRPPAPRPARPVAAPMPTLPSPAPSASETSVAVAAGPPSPPTPVVAPAAPATAAAPPAAATKAGAIGGKGVDLSGYLGRVNEAVAAKRRYPEMAVQLQLEGDVLVLVRINRDGSLASQPTIARSCGHELLDAEALRMVTRATPLPALPAEHPHATAEVRIPVRFRLED